MFDWANSPVVGEGKSDVIPHGVRHKVDGVLLVARLLQSQRGGVDTLLTKPGDIRVQADVGVPGRVSYGVVSMWS